MFERAALKAGRASQKLTTVESMIAGAIAGSATVLLTNPIWVVNTRMTARKSESKDAVLPTVAGSDAASAAATQSKKKSPSTLGTLRALIKDEGFRSLFAGVLPALVLVINPILQYTIFEQLKNVIEKRKGRVGPRDTFALGALGKLLATTITYPYITVKSRAHVASKEGPQDGMMQSLKRVVREEGWAGLYGGKFNTFSLSSLPYIYFGTISGKMYNRFSHMKQVLVQRSHKASSLPPFCSRSRTCCMT